MLLQDILTEKLDLTTNYNQAVKSIAAILPWLQRAGRPVNGIEIGKILNVNPQYAEKIIQWALNKGKLNPTALTNTNSSADPLSQLVVDAYTAKQHGLGMGLTKIAQRTGLDPNVISQIVANQWDQLANGASQLGLNLKPSFFKPNTPSEQYDKQQENLGDAIRRVMHKLTDGFASNRAASVSAQEIADLLGVARTSVDRELSNNPALRDLEPFRKQGKRPGFTDEDRANRYYRELKKSSI